MRRALRLLALLAACAAAPAVAQDLPEPVCGYLNDFAGVLPPDRAEALRHELQVTRRMTGAQIDVVALPDLRHFDSGESLLQFSQRMLRDWEIGDIRRQDGILLLLIAAPLEARIELGAGYNRHWDRIARNIVADTVLPAARQGRIGDGLIAGALAARDRIARPFAEGQRADGQPAPLHYVAAVIFAVAGLLALMRRRVNLMRLAAQPCPNCRRRGGLRRQIDRRADRETSLTYCLYCNHQREEELILPDPATPAREGA